MFCPNGYPTCKETKYNISSSIFATAKEEFESTNDWKKTGWLMPDGTQLDFAEGGDYRGTDHRAIGAAYKGTAEHQWQYLQDFENRGGIRIHMNRDGKYGTIEMAIKPTAEQKKKLRSFINAVGGNVDIDFMDENYNTTHAVSYEGVSPTRALSGITNFYDKGIKPNGNVSYSIERANEQFNKDIVSLSAREVNDHIFNLGRPSSILLDCGVEDKPIRLYGAKLLAKAKKHNYELAELVDLPISIASPIAVFKGSYKGAFAILTEIMVKGNNVLVALSIGKGGHDVDFNVVSSIYDKQKDSIKRWEESGKLLYVNKEKVLNYLSTSAPIADTLDNQELVSTDKDTTSNPKNQISEQDSYSINRDDIATPEMDAEANKELTESQKAAKVIADEIEERIQKIAQSKELTFEQIEQLMLDEKDDTSAIRRLVYIYNQAQGSKPKKTQAEADAAVEELGEKYNLTIDEAKALLKERGTAYTAMREGTVKKKCRAESSALSLVGEAIYFSGRITMYAILLSAKTLAARALISS